MVDQLIINSIISFFLGANTIIIINNLQYFLGRAIYIYNRCKAIDITAIAFVIFYGIANYIMISGVLERQSIKRMVLLIVFVIFSWYIHYAELQRMFNLNE